MKNKIKIILSSVILVATLYLIPYVSFNCNSYEWYFIPNITILIIVWIISLSCTIGFIATQILEK